ncbi:RNA polymerase sigma factor [Arundinibacter roseus]|uniref:RNA polymerase sigma factor n=1 Tax=Arundinibacter roseus TaxID=2070510 RepID=A0A4R4KLE3_9BACT|nr:RNA polymerase sigma factor [Arundinibacter roseus]TDB69174.1 RNA polymerase sigma factor [Arundinibacter roseus]
MTVNEHDLVNGCRQRDRGAQKRLYDVFAGKMFALCLRYVKNRADAEDILQESFIKIYENIDSFRGDSPLQYWLKSIVVNTALKHIRKQKPWMDLDDVQSHEANVAESANPLSGFQMQQLLEFIQELPHGCQTVFNLYAIEGYQHNEIAELMGISEGTSKSQYSRARTLLQQKLNKEQRFDNESVRKTQF